MLLLKVKSSNKMLIYRFFFFFPVVFTIDCISLVLTISRKLGYMIETTVRCLRGHTSRYRDQNNIEKYARILIVYEVINVIA